MGTKRRWAKERILIIVFGFVFLKKVYLVSVSDLPRHIPVSGDRQVLLHIYHKMLILTYFKERENLYV